MLLTSVLLYPFSNIFFHIFNQVHVKQGYLLILNADVDDNNFHYIAMTLI